MIDHVQLSLLIINYGLARKIKKLVSKLTPHSFYRYLHHFIHVYHSLLSRSWSHCFKC